MDITILRPRPLTPHWSTTIHLLSRRRVERRLIPVVAVATVVGRTVMMLDLLRRAFQQRSIRLILERGGRW